MQNALTLTNAGLASAPSGTAAAAAVLNPSPAAVATAASHRRHFLDVFQSFRRSWDLINSSSLFRRLALCMAVVGIVSEVRGACFVCRHKTFQHNKLNRTRGGVCGLTTSYRRSQHSG